VRNIPIAWDIDIPDKHLEAYIAGLHKKKRSIDKIGDEIYNSVVVVLEHGNALVLLLLCFLPMRSLD